MHAPEAHLLCCALVATDALARTVRLSLVVGALGHALPFARAVVIVLTGDAASAVTPYRAGGDIVRVAGLERAGVPRAGAVLAILSESVQTWPVIAGGGAVLLWLYGGGAWAAALAGLAAFAQRLGAWLAVVPPIIAALAWLAPRVVRRFARRGPPLDPRGTPLSIVAATLPLTAAAILARVLILPVLVSTLAAPPPLGPSVLGSFAMIHAQSLLPLPAGAGAVEAGFLAGFRRTDAARVLVYWRLYTTASGLALGAAASLYATMDAWRCRRFSPLPSPPA
jgi:uncharacterized membrane protein YbhN (UPF0104 family)